MHGAFPFGRKRLNHPGRFQLDSMTKDAHWRGQGIQPLKNIVSRCGA
jgi:hypothetical protein